MKSCLILHVFAVLTGAIHIHQQGNIADPNITTPCFSHDWRQNLLAELHGIVNLQQQTATHEGDMGKNCLDEDDLAKLTSHPEDAEEMLGEADTAFGSHTKTSESEEEDEICKIRPSLLYIGTGHSGSTTLATELNKHPEMKYGKMKEHSFLHYGAQTFASYLKEFRVPCTTKVTFDAFPSTYTRGNPTSNDELGSWRGFHLGLEYVKEVKKLYGPHLKILMMIRDPVQYLISFSLNLGDGQKGSARKFNLEDFISGKTSTSWGRKQLRNACYADHLEAWLKVFPIENFLFIKAEDYFLKPQPTLNQIFDFVEVSRKTYDQSDLKPSGRRRTVAAQDRVSFLARFLYHHNPAHKDCKERLESMTNLKFDWPGSV